MFANANAFSVNPLAGIAGLTARVAVYIPSTIHDRPAPADVVNRHRDAAAALLSRLFGGFTEVPASGGWWSDRLGRLIREPVFICYAGCGPDEQAKHLAAVVSFAKSVAVAMDQEAVTVEVNGLLYFVPQPDQTKAAPTALAASVA